MTAHDFTVWTRERFEAAATSSDPAVRKRLFDALAATHYPAPSWRASASST